MSLHKQSYFQGGGGLNEPSPKKEKYKPEKSEVVQTRFKEPFYKNYDLYDVPGKHGPGTGAYHMNKHKSIKEFLNKKRKKMKRKYAQDNWMEEQSAKTKERSDNIKLRTKLLSQLIKNAIDFSIDDQIDSGIIEDKLDLYQNTVKMDGRLDKYYPLYDFEGKSPEKLNFGRDYPDSFDEADPDLLDELEGKILSPRETDLMGMPNGFDPEEDLDGDKTYSEANPYYGTTDLGNLIYQNMWI